VAAVKVYAAENRPDVVALAGVSLVVGSGEMVALMGPSGCGKSTVVNLSMRVYEPQQGRRNQQHQDGRQRVAQRDRDASRDRVAREQRQLLQCHRQRQSTKQDRHVHPSALTRLNRRPDRGDRPLVGGVQLYATGRFPASWFLDEAEVLTFEH